MEDALAPPSLRLNLEKVKSWAAQNRSKSAEVRGGRRRSVRCSLFAAMMAPEPEATREPDHPDEGSKIAMDCEGRAVTQAELDRWTAVFGKLRQDGEMHAEDLVRALQLCGHEQLEYSGVAEVLAGLTKFSTLSEKEFVRFICRFEANERQRYRAEFARFDADGSGSIDAGELAALFESLGVPPMKCVLEEVIAEVDDNGTGCLEFEEFEQVIEIVNKREGFLRRELAQFRKVFRNLDSDHSGEIDSKELAGALAWLGFPTSLEEAEVLCRQEDVDNSGALSEREFLRCLRRVREREVGRIKELLAARDGDDSGTMKGTELEGLLRSLGYTASPEAILDAAQAAGLGIDQSALSGLCSLKGLQFDFGLSELWLLLRSLRACEGFARAEMRDLKDSFELHDARGGGELTAGDAGRAILWAGYPASFDERQQLIAEVDIEGSGVFDFPMFVKLARSFRDRERRAAVAAFDIYAEGKAILSDSHGAQLGALWSLGCVNRDGKTAVRTPQERAGVDVHGFVHIVRRWKAKSREQLRRNAGFTGEELAELMAQFERYDYDGSGDISRKELVHLIEDLFPKYAHSAERRPQLARLIKEADADGSRSLDFKEFVTLMRRIRDQEDEEKAAKERGIAREAGFSHLEVRDFRELFLGEDEEGLGGLTFEQVHRMVSRTCHLGDTNCKILAGFFAEAVGDVDDNLADFSALLQIMRRVLDEGFANSQAGSAGRRPARLPPTSPLLRTPVREAFARRVEHGLAGMRERSSERGPGLP